MENAHMYFVAVVCPKEIDRQVSQFKKWMKTHFQCAVALRSPAHITLVKPFWIENNWEAYLIDTLRACKPGVPDFRVTLYGFSHFGRRVLFVNVQQTPELLTRKERVEQHFTRSFGDSLRREQLQFHPHVTIANRDLKPADFKPAWEHFSKTNYNATFEVKTISLLKLADGRWQVLADKILNDAG